MTIPVLVMAQYTNQMRKRYARISQDYPNRFTVETWDIDHSGKQYYHFDNYDKAMDKVKEHLS